MFQKRLQQMTQFIGWPLILALVLYGILATFGLTPVWSAQADDGAISARDAYGLMTYQGYVKDSGGIPLDGDYSMHFEIFDSPDPSTGSSEWGPEDKTVTVVDGYFSVLLGESKPITATIFTSSGHYMSVVVDPYGEMLPRQMISSAPHALVSTLALALTTNYVESEHLGPAYVDHNGDLNIENDLKMKNGSGICIESDDLCGNVNGGIKIGADGIYGSNSSSSNVYLVPTSGNVGIRTKTVPSTLTVEGDADISGPLESGSFHSTGNATIDGNADVAGDITWSGDLLGFTVSEVHKAYVYQTEEPNVVPLTPLSSSICFLSRVYNHSDSDTYFRCEVYKGNTEWQLIASNEGTAEQETMCWAYCLSW